MDVLSLQVFVSLVLVLVSILLFAHAAKGRDHEHADRLALLPLADDRRGPPDPPDASMPDGTPTNDGPRAVPEPR